MERPSEQGQTDLTKLIQARQRLIQLKTAEIDATGAATQAQADLLLALGAPALIQGMLNQAEGAIATAAPSASPMPTPIPNSGFTSTRRELLPSGLLPERSEFGSKVLSWNLNTGSLLPNQPHVECIAVCDRVSVRLPESPTHSRWPINAGLGSQGRSQILSQAWHVRKLHEH